jgi:hypothetical protein
MRIQTEAGQGARIEAVRRLRSKPSLPETIPFETLLASYREHGYKKGNLAGLEVQTLGHWGVFVTVHWIIDHVNGSILRDFKSSYNLYKLEDNWRILVTTNHDHP